VNESGNEPRRKQRRQVGTSSANSRHDARDSRVIAASSREFNDSPESDFPLLSPLITDGERGRSSGKKQHATARTEPPERSAFGRCAKWNSVPSRFNSHERGNEWRKGATRGGRREEGRAPVPRRLIEENSRRNNVPLAERMAPL